jgi:hypothetical protein
MEVLEEDEKEDKKEEGEVEEEEEEEVYEEHTLQVNANEEPGKAMIPVCWT